MIIPVEGNLIEWGWVRMMSKNYVEDVKNLKQLEY